MANVSNLNSFLASLVKRNLGDTDGKKGLSDKEKEINDALFNFSSEAGSMWDKMLAGEWDAANDIADDLIKDIDEKREIAEVLSGWDVGDDGKINVSEIDEDSDFGTVANIFAGDTTTTFSIEDFQNYAKLLDLDNSGKIEDDEKSAFGTLVAGIKNGTMGKDKLDETEQNTAIEALKKAIQGLELSASQQEALEDIKGAFDVMVEDGEGDDKTPTVEDGEDKTPTVGDGEDKTPTVGDGDDKTPTVGDGDDKTPTVGDGDDKKDTNFTLPAGWTDAEKTAFNNVKTEIEAFGIYGEVAKVGGKYEITAADGKVYTYEINTADEGADTFYIISQTYNDTFGDTIKINKSFKSSGTVTTASKTKVRDGVTTVYNYSSVNMKNENITTVVTSNGTVTVNDLNGKDSTEVTKEGGKLFIAGVEVIANATINADGTFKIGSKEYNADGTEKVTGGSTGSGSTGGSTPETSETPEDNFAEVINEHHLEEISAFGITSGKTTKTVDGKTTTYTIENGGVTYTYTITQSTEGAKTRYDVTQTYTDKENDSISVRREKVFVDNSEIESKAGNFVIVDNGNNIKEIIQYAGNIDDDSNIIGSTLVKYNADGTRAYEVSDLNLSDNTKYEIKGDKIVVLLPKKDGTSVEIEVTSDIAIAADGTIAGRKFVDGYVAEGLIDGKFYEDGLDTTATVDLSTLPTTQGANTNITWKRVDVDGEKELRYNAWTHGDWNYSNSTYDANGRLTGMDVSKKDGTSTGKYFDAVYEPTQSFKLETSTGLIVTFDGLITNGSDAEIIEIKKADDSGYTGLYGNIYYVNGTKQVGRGVYGDTLYENGSPVGKDTEIIFDGKLYRGGKQSTNAFDTITAENGDKIYFANGELINGLSDASGTELYYEDGKLFTGNKDGNNYDKGVKLKGKIVFDKETKTFKYEDGTTVEDGTVGNKVYKGGKLISETEIVDGKQHVYNYESSEFDAQGRPTDYTITIKNEAGTYTYGTQEWSGIEYNEAGSMTKYTKIEKDIDGNVTKNISYAELKYNGNNKPIQTILTEKDAKGNVTSSIEKLNIKYNEAGDVTSESVRNYVIEDGKVTSAFELTEGGKTVMCSGVDGDGNPVIANEVEIAGKMYKDGALANEEIRGVMYVNGEKANNFVKNADGEDIMYQNGVIADEIKVGDIMYKDGKVAQSVIIGDKMYDAGKLANDVIINNALWMNGEKVDNLQNSVLGIVGILADTTANVYTSFTADTLRDKWATLNNHQRAILSHFVELDENGKVKLDANNKPIINDFFYMVASGNTTAFISGAAVPLNTANLQAALGCATNGDTITNNHLEKLQVLKDRAAFLKAMDLKQSFLDNTEVPMAEIRNRQDARTELGLTEDLDNYTWKLINGELPNTTASTSTIRLDELISADRDAKFYENAKVVSELIQEIDDFGGVKDGQISAESIKNLYNALLSNPKAEGDVGYTNWIRKVNMLKALMTTNVETGVITGATTINSAASMNNFAKIAYQMLIDGSIDTPYTPTGFKTNEEFTTNWSIQRLLNAVTGKTNTTSCTDAEVINAYNTTTDPELKSLLRLLVKTNENGWATAVNGEFRTISAQTNYGAAGTVIEYRDLTTFLITLDARANGGVSSLNATLTTNINLEQWFCMDYWS